MTIKVPNEGELKIIEWALNDDSTTAPEDFTLEIFKNDYTPVDTSTGSDFTAATFTGYSAATLTRGSFSGPTTNAQGKAELTYTEQQWDASSDETVYGYWVRGATSGTVIWAERFSGARPLTNGDTIRIVPKITCKTEY